MKVLSASRVSRFFILAFLSAYAIAQTHPPTVKQDTPQLKPKWGIVSNPPKADETNSPYLTSACVDSEKRFDLWLANLKAKP